MTHNIILTIFCWLVKVFGPWYHKAEAERICTYYDNWDTGYWYIGAGWYYTGPNNHPIGRFDSAVEALDHRDYSDMEEG